MSEKMALLRRPRAPERIEQKVLPPIQTQTVSHHKLKSNDRLNSHHRLRNSPNLKGSSPDLRRLLPSSTHDGLNSPVPTFDDQSANSSQGTWSKRGLVKPYKPRGPDNFPVREPRQPLEVKREYILPDDSHYASKTEFRFEDFMLENKSISPPKSELREAVLSKTNYQKLTNFLQGTSEGEDGKSLSMIYLNEQAKLETVPKKVPRGQVLLEMKQVIQERLEELGITSETRLGEIDKLGEVLNEVHEMGANEGVGVRSQMSIFTKATAQVFQGGHRSASPFTEDEGESFITPSELALLNCLIEGGFVLSLKAHFVSQVPDLNPLAQTLVYLNLSFNEFSLFPREVLQCRELHVLKLRNNPLKEIPKDINRLSKLRTLILSFCCLTSLPLTVYSLIKLEFLDVSYNKLTFLQNEVKNLEQLRFLNVEGNELPALPCGLLRLNLFRIRVRNNFMSPLLWKENSQNGPQRLSDICSLLLQNELIRGRPEQYAKLPDAISQILTNYNICDCCCGPMYGPGLRIIRPCSEIWGIRRIPFMFRSCSPKCYRDFVVNTDPRMTEIIYGQQRCPQQEDQQDEALRRPDSV